MDRFTDMGDGTVRDNDSGVTWLKDAFTFTQTKRRSQAVTTVAQLAGNWRLPSRVECAAFLDNTYTNPALANGKGDEQWSDGDIFVNVKSTYYWTVDSGITSKGNPYYHAVNVGDTIVRKTYHDSGEAFVWPIRSGN